MPEQPATSPIDPAYIAEVQQLFEEGQMTLARIVTLSARVGKVMEQFDALRTQLPDQVDESGVELLRELTGYGRLLDTMFAIAGYAAAAADHTSTFPEPPWYCQLREQRRQRYAAEVA